MTGTGLELQSVASLFKLLLNNISHNRNLAETLVVLEHTILLLDNAINDEDELPPRKKEYKNLQEELLILAEIVRQKIERI